jgi:deoxyribodipyrimidine photo-lyase
MSSVVLFWFRRDLRLHDNTALNKAVEYCKKTNSKLFPLFIFDPNILSELDEDDLRVNFIHQSLTKIQNTLNEFNSNLNTFHNDPNEVFKNLINQHTVVAIYCNEDYEPYAINRDLEIKQLCKQNNIEFNEYKDQVIFHKDDIVKADGSPYVVYTPYKNKWLTKFQDLNLSTKKFSGQQVLVTEPPIDIISLKSIGFTFNNTSIPDSTISESLISHYDKTRDFPSVNKGTSRIGVHLRFGTISIRELIHNIQKMPNYETYLNELIWREFFMQILWHFPKTVNSAFKPKYDRIQWSNNEELFYRWKSGTTGYPIVDAGMRELKETGYMHNRVRMIVASFLCKHLLIDWRWGEAYFANHLLDYELASNIGNWQWASGSGVDAAPYFRIFNPHTQLKKFDPKHEYIKKMDS